MLLFRSLATRDSAILRLDDIARGETNRGDCDKQEVTGEAEHKRTNGDDRFLEDEESSRLHCWSETYTSWNIDRPRKPLNNTDADADADAPQKPPVSTSRIRTNLERRLHHALSCRYRERAKGSSRSHILDG